jgi:hypothetical protein
MSISPYGFAPLTGKPESGAKLKEKTGSGFHFMDRQRGPAALPDADL